NPSAGIASRKQIHQEDGGPALGGSRAMFERHTLTSVQNVSGSLNASGQFIRRQEQVQPVSYRVARADAVHALRRRVPSDDPAFGVNHYHRVLRGLDDRSHSRDLPFGAFLFADIVEDGGGAQQPSGLVVETRNRDRYFQSAAILLERGDFGMMHGERAAALRRGEFTRHTRPRAVAPFRRDQQIDKIRADGFGGGKPEQLFRGGVPARHLAVRADAQNPVFRRLDERREQSLLAFELHEFRDVAADRSDRVHFAVRIVDGKKIEPTVKRRAVGTRAEQPEALRHVRARYLLDRGGEPFRLVRRQKIEHGPLERGFRRHAEEPFGSPVPAHDSAVEAGPNDGILG